MTAIAENSGSVNLPVLPAESDLERFEDPGEYVILACERAKTWLAQALDHGDIDQIVELKSQAEAIRVYTAQKQLGHDAELSAAEVVRRAERGIGLAIRRGQDKGEIRRRGQSRGEANKNLLSPSSFGVPGHDLVGGGSQPGIYDLTDDVTDDQFDEAIEEAKQEENLSRANVARKVPKRETKSETTETVDKSRTGVRARERRLCELAQQGYTSDQIAAELGVSRKAVSGICHRLGVVVPADAVVGKRRDHDSNRILSEMVYGLEAYAMSLDLIDVASIDADQTEQWVISIKKSVRSISQFLKEIPNDQE